MNVTLTESGYTLDGKWRLVPVEPTYEMEILSLNGGLDYKLGVKAAPPPPQQSPWQPISTAPKDWIVFDVWSKRLGRVPDCAFGASTYGKESGIIYQSDYDCDGPVYAVINDATHWMPLPEPAP